MFTVLTAGEFEDDDSVTFARSFVHPTCVVYLLIRFRIGMTQANFEHDVQSLVRLSEIYSDPTIAEYRLY